MKKPVIIIIGGLIVTALVAVWGYLFFFGTPESAEEVYSDLGLQGSTDTSLPTNPVVVEEVTPAINMERANLRQLSTKQIAGFGEVKTSTTTPSSLYYTEMGTGHIFNINLTTGEEVRVSGTTVPKAYKADISVDGKFAAVSTLNSTKDMELFLLELDTSSSPALEAFSQTVSDFTINEDGELMYAETNNQGLIASSYNFKTKKINSLFTIPFREASIDWGERVSSPHYIFPKATYALEGFLYQALAGKLTRLPLSGTAFAASGNEDIIVYNEKIQRETRAFIYDLAKGESRPLDAVVVPEKCLLPATGLNFICPFDPSDIPQEFPDVWYAGDTSFKDSIWRLDGENMIGEPLVDTLEESGREIDIVDLEISLDNNVLYFINKNDNTLWMYEL